MLWTDHSRSRVWTTDPLVISSDDLTEGDFSLDGPSLPLPSPSYPHLLESSLDRGLRYTLSGPRLCLGMCSESLGLLRCVSFSWLYSGFTSANIPLRRIVFLALGFDWDHSSWDVDV